MKNSKTFALSLMIGLYGCSSYKVQDNKKISHASYLEKIKYKKNRSYSGSAYRVPASGDQKLENLVKKLQSPFDQDLVDTKGPIVSDVKVDGDFKVGDNKLLLRITDDISGVGDSINPCGYFQHSEKNSSTVTVCGGLKPVGDDWYETNVSVSKFVSSGSYGLYGLDISDKAGNSTRWSAPNSFKINILNDNPEDLKGPFVSELKVDDKDCSLHVGGKGKLWFKAQDDISGISEFKGSCDYFQSSDASSTIYVCGNIKNEENDWYSIEFEIGDFVTSGIYSMHSFSVSDKAENSNQKNELHLSFSLKSRKDGVECNGENKESGVSDDRDKLLSPLKNKSNKGKKSSSVIEQ
jgi:hypothetical protein